MKWSDFIVPKTNYATHNLSKTVRGSYSPGLLYPVWNRVMLPGDRFKINLRSLFRTNPVKAPLMGSFKYRFVTVAANFKNYAVGLEGYQRSFDWRSFLLPTIGWTVPTGLNDGYVWDRRTQLFSVRETSLADYLGYQRGWSPNNQLYNDKTDGDIVNLRKSAFPFLVYYDFYRNYLVNPQEDFYPICRSRTFMNHDVKSSMPPAEQWSGFVMQKLSDLDLWFRTVHTTYNLDTDDTSTAARDVFSLKGSPIFWPSFDNVIPDANGLADIKPVDMASYHGGLVSTMFDPDLNTNWMSVANYSRLSEVQINTQGSSGAQYVSYQDVIKSSHLWDFVFREVTGGGTYSDLIYSQYGVSVKADQNIPQIIHVFDGMIGFEDITATAAGFGLNAETGLPSEEVPVGEQFGVGRGYGQSPSFTVSNPDNNFCLLMTFLWITPNVDYATGVPAESNITKFSDLYFPAFDNYSMQPRFREQLDASAYVQSHEPTNPIPPDVFSDDALLRIPADANHPSMAREVLGYQPAFAEYKSDVNTVHGLFKNQLSYWANIRRIPYLVGTNTDNSYFSSYVYYTVPGTQTQTFADAAQYDTVFSVQNEDNFQAQIRIDVKATRPISKSVMPHVK